MENNIDDIKEQLYSITGICGCGLPESALKLLYRVLKEFIKLDSIDLESNEEDWIKIHENINQLFNYKYGDDNGLYWTYLYWLNDKGLLEHGSSVSSGWITAEGREVISLIEQVYPEFKNEK